MGDSAKNSFHLYSAETQLEPRARVAGILVSWLFQLGTWESVSTTACLTQHAFCAGAANRAVINSNATGPQIYWAAHYITPSRLNSTEMTVPFGQLGLSLLVKSVVVEDGVFDSVRHSSSLIVFRVLNAEHK